MRTMKPGMSVSCLPRAVYSTVCWIKLKALDE